MDSLKWTLIFVCICLNVIQAKATGWTIKVPSSVKGLLGSCVVIPCSYDYPDPEKTVTTFTGMWNDAKNQLIYHPVESKVMQQYRNRTELLGDVRHKNCSMKIDPLQESDSGPFHFRIVIENHNKYSYLRNTVTITMIHETDPISFSKEKEEVQEGQRVSASCSVSHSCPSSPPVFTWSHSGEAHDHHQQLADGQWIAKSTLTFQATRADHSKSLKCTVRYKGGKQQEESKVLKVNYAPEIQTTSSCSVEAGVVKCVCSVESSPPSMVRFALSDRVVPSTKEERNGSVSIATLQAELGSSEFIFCVANNTQGSANLTLSLAVVDKMQSLYIIIAAGAGVILLIILIAVGIFKGCRGRSRDVPAPHIGTRKEENDMRLSQYTATQRKGTNYEDVDCSAIYSNDPVYGNIQAVCDHEIYANM